MDNLQRDNQKRATISSKRGLLEFVIGIILFILLPQVLGGWMGWGFVILLPFMIAGLALIGIGVIDMIVGIARKQMQWGMLLWLRVAAAIIATSWLFVGSK